MNRLFIIMGPPGVGKTTLVSRLVERLRTLGIKVGGVISYEKRHSGRRVGFEVLDLGANSRATLALESSGAGPRVGKYIVNLEGLADVAAPAIDNAVKMMDVVVIDEVGPMELYSPEFRRAVERAMASSKPVIVVVHERSKDPLARKLRHEVQGERLVIDYHNRDELLEKLQQKVKAYIEVHSRVS